MEFFATWSAAKGSPKFFHREYEGTLAVQLGGGVGEVLMRCYGGFNVKLGRG